MDMMWGRLIAIFRAGGLDPGILLSLYFSRQGRGAYRVCTIASMYSFYYFVGTCIQMQVYGVRVAANMSCLHPIMLVGGRVQISGGRRPLSQPFFVPNTIYIEI